jgi:transcriptional regulator with XRE-family HTH domain
MNTAVDNLSLIPRPGSLAWPGTHGTWCLAAFSANRTEDVLLQRTRHVVTRRRDHLIDKKIGSVIRMRRIKLGLSQTDLGNALGVTFQQIQKYENGTNAVASTRISDLCRALEMTPNDLFGASSKMDGEVSKLSSRAMKIALKLDDASPALRQAIDAMLNAGPKR